MGSRALYRKHRSKTFDEVVGQSHITDTLKNALKKGAVSHAYLFTGPRGVGKTSVARILAHAVNGIEYGDETTHLDIIEIDAASNRRIDEIRDLRDKVHIAPTSAQFKVYIIDEVHMLTREAFNALLKTLEEPPEHAVFILATTESHKIPDTITSRTQKFTFKPIAKETLVEHLRDIAQKENITISDDALAAVAQHGNGSFRDSISVLDQLSGLGKADFQLDDVHFLLGLPSEQLLTSVIDAVAQHDTKLIFEAVQSMKEHGVDVNQAARSLSRLVRDQLIEQSLSLSTDQAVSLLKGLLPLTQGPADYVALELCLLDNVHLGSTPAPPVKQSQPAETQSDNPMPQPTQSTAPQKKKTAEKTPSSQPPAQQAKRTEFTDEKWKQLLNDMKGHHNTLYGVLRMANTSHKNDKIMLAFQFDFHKKRIHSPDNSRTLNEYVAKHFGPYDVEVIVEKRTQTEPVAAAPKAENETISSVSSIFGGAELLD